MCSTPPSLLNYFYIPAIIIIVLLGFVVFYNNRKKITGRLFFIFSIVIAMWLLFNMLNFISIDYGNVLLYDKLSIIGVFIPPIFFIFIYFFSSDLESNDRNKKKLVLFLLPLLPFVFFATTKYNVEGLTPPPDCETIAGPLYWYSLGVTVFYIIASLALFFRKLKTGTGIVKKQMKIILIGFVFFAVWALMTNVVFQFIGLSSASLLAPVGAIFLIASISYAIVEYQFLNIKVLLTQALVLGLIVLAGSELLFVENTINKILILITLAAVIGFGYMLIKSVKLEIKQREEVEAANKTIAKKNSQLEVANAEITERKEQLQKMADSLSISNEQLKITYAKLEELDRAKADFISLANHQLKHAPTTIKSFLGMFLDGDYGQVPDNQAAILKNINDANDRQIHLADDLLQIIKMESNKVQLDFQKQSIEDVCQGVYDNLSAAAKERSLKLSYEKPEQALPEVLFDKNKVFEAIFNFVDNAIKYTKEGGITVKAEVSPSSSYKPQNSDDADKKPIQGSVVRVVVSDTGSGISKEHLGQLFAKFSRKDTSNLNSGGTGLGLFLVKLMIEAHGGRTWAESDGEGKGSRFIMELPIETPKEILEQVEGK